jgi:hypothetical protein
VTETNLVTKNDLKDAVADLEIAIHRQATHQIIWMTGALFAQGALVVALLQYLQ